MTRSVPPRRLVEGWNAGRAKPVGQAERQRRFRTDDREVDLAFDRRAGEVVEVIDGDGKIDRQRGGARVTRGAIERGVWQFLLEGPEQCMLSAPVSDYENSHVPLRAFVKASRAAWAARLAASATLLATSLPASR